MLPHYYHYSQAVILQSPFPDMGESITATNYSKQYQFKEL